MLRVGAAVALAGSVGWSLGAAEVLRCQGLLQMGVQPLVEVAAAGVGCTMEQHKRLVEMGMKVAQEYSFAWLP